MSEVRLDVAMAARGLARSRTHAAGLIEDGLVTVDGAPVVKSSTIVSDRQEISVAPTDHYVGRAAHKLSAGLDAFPVLVEGRRALDVGASTGGFTQVLLERGAEHVIALDVGHGQLAPTIRSDPRVTNVEGVNARNLSRVLLAEISPGGVIPSIVVADLSFISLKTVLPALTDSTGLEANYVLLVKPQFEVGRGGIREGVVKTAHQREDAVNGVLWSAWDLGLGTAGVISSPIAGMSGNREYLVWLSAEMGTNPTEWLGQVSDLA